MTTAERYAPRTTQAGTAIYRSPDLVQAFVQAREAAAEAQIQFARTIEAEGSISAEVRAQLLQELAALSVDPDAMDRDSEVDIWGFHNDA